MCFFVCLCVVYVCLVCEVVGLFMRCVFVCNGVVCVCVCICVCMCACVCVCVFVCVYIYMYIYIYIYIYMFLCGVCVCVCLVCVGVVVCGSGCVLCVLYVRGVWFLVCVFV